MVQLTRRHRAVALGLASVAGGAFVIFVTRVFLLGPPQAPLRTCGPSAMYEGLSFTGAKLQYHFVMDSLTQERMNLYEGKTPLACNGETVAAVIPPGQFATQVAAALRQTNFTSSPPASYFSPFTYADFEKLLTEFWRTYDCHLLALQTDAGLLGATVPREQAGEEQETFVSTIPATSKDILELERLRARHTLDRLLFLFRSPEQYLPLHASLRCLERGGIDVRNALALIADANQCLEAKLGQPETSLLK